MFPLCRTLADEKQQSACQHSDDERALISTWVSEELKLAKKKEYHISQIYEFWGRWGMNLNKTKLSYVNNVSDFNRYLSVPTKNIKNIFLPSEEVAAIEWQVSSEFVEQDASTNIFIATFTTAWARFKLYHEMDKLGRDVLYHDTDSLVYASNGRNDSPLGNFLGDFTDELEGDTIKTFVSGGPKNYAYKTESGVTCCKVEGLHPEF
ncbi:uncharacterized protein NPIL_325421 [Nephila pilipes]|uniref:DNA-directed DNA polymerase n=1 Tax=Nephila pilipes TaxID=299642 RepID=A0A8X6MUM9_NEPPI|nr:uncharacterized protein NPIL_325421 [Nephila pilipes]